MARLFTNYEGAWDPRVRCKWVPPKKGNTRVWHVTSLKEVWEKKKGRMRQLWQKGTSRLWQKKNWKRLTWGLTRTSRACCAYVECGPRGQAGGPACQDIPHGNRRANSQRSTEIASRRIHQDYLASPLAIQHSTGKKEERADKMMCRFLES